MEAMGKREKGREKVCVWRFAERTPTEGIDVTEFCRALIMTNSFAGI